MRSGTFLKRAIVIVTGALAASPATGQSPVLNAGSVDAMGLIGYWQSDKRGGFQVAIEACGDALCGTIVRDLTPIPPEGNDADAEKHPTVGWQILRNFKRNQKGEWIGEMHDYRNGKQYECVMALVSPDELMVRPFIGIRLIGKKHLWLRVADTASRAPP